MFERPKLEICPCLSLWFLGVCLWVGGGCGTQVAAPDGPVATRAGGATVSPDGVRRTGDGRPESMLRGNIQIDGSSTVKPIGEAVAKRFARIHPKVRVDVGGRGTGNGLKRFGAREIDFAHASRPVLPREGEQLQQSEITYLELPIAYDGLTIVVHPQNDWVQSLTLDQLRKIFLQSSGTQTWQDIDPTWPAQPMKVFAPGTGSGTYDYFLDVLGDELRSGMSLNEDDNALVTGVSGNLYSIGFFGVAYYNENREKLRAVGIVNPEDGQAYLPEGWAIEQNHYNPLSRPLFLYVNQQSLRRVEVRTFLKHYIESVPELVGNVGFVRLPAAIWEQVERAIVQPDEHVGSRFIDPHGQRRHGRFEDIFLEHRFPEAMTVGQTSDDPRVGAKQP